MLHCCLLFELQLLLALLNLLVLMLLLMLLMLLLLMLLLMLLLLLNLLLLRRGLTCTEGDLAQADFWKVKSRCACQAHCLQLLRI